MTLCEAVNTVGLEQEPFAKIKKKCSDFKVESEVEDCFLFKKNKICYFTLPFKALCVHSKAQFKLGKRLATDCHFMLTSLTVGHMGI